MNWVFELLIPLWPVVFFLAAANSLFIPDRYRLAPRDDGDDEHWTAMSAGLCGVLWLATIFWWVPAYMTQHGASDFNVPGFWLAVKQTLLSERTWLKAGRTPLYLGGYFVTGLVWAVVYFWVYARRLGHLYVAERDAWLARTGVKSLDGLSAEQKLKFRTVIEAVKKQMHYRGDFPLRPFQQKRFFSANLVLWPLTLACYLFGDLVMDVARSVWFALRNWIHAQWVAGMAEYHADEVLCREFEAALAAKKPEKQDESPQKRGNGAIFSGRRGSSAPEENGLPDASQA